MGVKRKEEEFFKKKVTIYVQTPVIAPALPNIKVFKIKKLQHIENCYKELYKDNPEQDKILDQVRHLDRAFERREIDVGGKIICQPFIPGHVLSGVLQKKVDPTIIVRGIIEIPPDSIIIDLKKRAEGLLVTEEILPGTVLNGEIYINKDITKSVIGNLYSMTQKGYGQVLVTFS